MRNRQTKGAMLVFQILFTIKYAQKKETHTDTEAKNGIDKRNINQMPVQYQCDAFQKPIEFSLIEFNANTVIIYELFELSPNRLDCES